MLAMIDFTPQQLYSVGKAMEEVFWLPIEPKLFNICKVEFIQPSNWLYSVTNLLVIQHLVTLYLGGFDVRVVSELE